MMQEIELLKTVCETLNRVDIPYMLTGSMAMGFYATPRMTRDLDIVIEILQPKAIKLFEALQGNFYISKSAIDEAIRYESMFNAIHLNSAMKIDFIINKKSPFSLIEFQRRCALDLNGTPVWVISCEDLIISKLHWAKDSFSEQQIRDITNLMSADQNLDIQYIQHWVLQLGLEKIYTSVKSV